MHSTQQLFKSTPLDATPMAVEEHNGHKHLNADRQKHTFSYQHNYKVVIQRHMGTGSEKEPLPNFIHLGQAVRWRKAVFKKK